MKKLVFLALSLLMAVCQTAFADGYDVLWKQYDVALKKDLPRTALGVLGRIEKKGRAEKQYGNVLKALICRMDLKESIAPDSLAGEIKRLEAAELGMRTKQPVLAAVYQSALAQVYNKYRPNDDYDIAAKNYYSLSVKHPELLAKTSAKGYEPLLKAGIDSRIFNNDLLHVLAIAANEYGLMYRYYSTTGNRKAACLTAALMFREGYNDFVHGTNSRDDDTSGLFESSKYVRQLDSLINVYADLPEACELAICKCDMWYEASDRKLGEMMKFIDYASSKWNTWKRVGLLRNTKRALTNPEFSVACKEMALSGKPQKIYLYNIYNVKRIAMKVWRLKIDGQFEQDITNAKVLQALRATMKPVSSAWRECRITSKAAYENANDSVLLEGLPVGAYMLEFVADNKEVPVQRALLFVTNVTAVAQQLPNKRVRIAVLNATTGHPIPNAKLKLKLVMYEKDRSRQVMVTCNAYGETVFREPEGEVLERIYPFAGTDVYARPTDFDSDYESNDFSKKDFSVYLYTDRSIYRPGQTVNVAGMLMKSGPDLERNAVEGEDVVLRLFDTKSREVAKEKVVTDAFGKFSTTFVLPKSGLMGEYVVAVGWYGNFSTSFMVEEYKRPTFDVTFDEVKEKYAPSDTIEVSGYAKSFAGVPVQGAKVKYEVKRTPALWCWWRSRGDDYDEDVFSDTTITDAKGAFRARVPLIMPSQDSNFGFYDFKVKATVVDQAGETRLGFTTLPLGQKPTTLYCDLPDKIEKDSLKTLLFERRNAKGTAIEGDVRYYIDKENEVHTAKANEAFAFNGAALASGKHQLVAICERDTFESAFVVFCINDVRPVVKTNCWSYQTAKRFRQDNKPVYVQVGTSLKDAYLIYSIYAGNDVLDMGAEAVSDSILTISYTYKPEYANGITISYVWVQDDSCYTCNMKIGRAIPDKRLVAEWKTFRDRLSPGQQELWTLSLKHPDGTPANAQLMATLYDKSLEQILKHRWRMGLGFYLEAPDVDWQWLWDNGAVEYSGARKMNLLRVPSIKLYHFSSQCFDYYPSFGEEYAIGGERILDIDEVYELSKVRFTAPVIKRDNQMKNQEELMAFKAVDSSTRKEADEAGDDRRKVGKGRRNGTMPAEKADKPAFRENLNETAFFYPALTTDDNGDVAIRFTLPESITTWRFMGLATDKELNNVVVENEAVATKKMMVQPNMPRFMRLGDKGWIAARVMNTTEETITGKALMEILDAETQRVVYSEQQTCTVNAGQTGNVSFLLDVQEGTSFYNAGPKVWVCRISVSGNGFSDGEQHYLPLLSDAELVTNTRAFTMHGRGKLNIDLHKLFAVNRNDNQLTIEYTNNPAWMMVQTLPYVARYFHDDAISLATSLYVNGLAHDILQHVPAIKQTIQLWKQEKHGEGSMISELEKNEELKNLVLNETPWVWDAKNETNQRQELLRFFDENDIRFRLDEAAKRLRELQKENGSWSWYPDMLSSKYVTLAVVDMIARLETLTGRRTEMEQNMERAFRYMNNVVRKEVAEMKKLETQGRKNVLPSEWALAYLYVSSLVDKQYYDRIKAERQYLIAHMNKQPAAFTIYGKAASAVILAKNGYAQMAKEYLQSIREYSVFTEEMGRYYDTPRAYYSWFDYRIPTQVAAIEAIQALEPQDTTTLDEMKRWLLQQKRTQMWDTPINSVNAVYAFLNGNMQSLQAAADSPATLSVDGVRLETPNASAGLGYVKTAVSGENCKTFTVDKTAKGTSWGSVYAQFMQRTTDIADASMGLTIKRELICDGELKVGSKVKVRITITAERDYDFIQVVEKRAACMEPANQLSGYRGRFYRTPRDNATYYFADMMPKGTHVIEDTYYIDRPGTFTTGTCTVQCAYNPAYMARTKAQTITIK